jgi:hypothetical protein
MLTTFIKIEILLLIIGFLLAVAYQFMIGRVDVKGLLSDSMNDNQISIGRIQLLVFMLAQAGTYAGQAMMNPHKFPAVPVGLLAAYGGSNITYLGAKSWPFIQSFLKGG